MFDFIFLISKAKGMLSYFTIMDLGQKFEPI